MTRLSPAAACSDEEGAAQVTSIVGVGVFLTFLLVVVQVVVFLFTASVAQAAAVDAASRGAGAAETQSRSAAAAHARSVLGELADDATVSTTIHDDASGQVLRVDVQVRIPTVLGAIGLATVERGAEARIEQ